MSEAQEVGLEPLWMKLGEVFLRAAVTVEVWAEGDPHADYGRDLADMMSGSTRCALVRLSVEQHGRPCVPVAGWQVDLHPSGLAKRVAGEGHSS